MTITVDHHPRRDGGPRAGRLAGIVSRCYGMMAYASFLASFLYAIGFAGNLVVPNSIDTGVVWPPFVAFCIDLQLLCVFAVQHGGMARPSFRRLSNGRVSPLVARSTYLLCTSLTLILLFAAWQPLSLLGWSIALHSILLVSRFDLFGLKQRLLSFAGRSEITTPFRTPGLYGVVRHPIYLGLMIALWAAPVMTAGHLLFAGLATAFMFAGIWLEERDHLALFGDRYRQYRARVAMLLPGLF
jgi:protein-S-isoprenylcysteine O-methyltransferase Ste14